MLCFCDIPPQSLDIHMEKYGRFGIAFPKGLLVREGATPVHYVAWNARNRDVGIGPTSVGQRFDELFTELRRLRLRLESYISAVDGAPAYLTKMSPPTTPEGHQILGRFSGIEGELDELVFARIKFFEDGLPEDHVDNYYMEREWRKPDGFSFQLSDVSRIILPKDYEERFRADIPDYSGPILLV